LTHGKTLQVSTIFLGKKSKKKLKLTRGKILF